MGYQTYSQALYYQSAAYRYQVQVARAQATRAAATVRIKKVCDTADKKWTGSSSGLVVGTAFVIPIPRVPVVPPVTTIPKPDLDTGNFSFPSLPKVPSAQDLANGIVGWFIGDYIQKIAKNGTYEDADYHSDKGNPVKTKNGQKALDNSEPISPNTTDRRIGISDGEIVILDKTSDGLFHGHDREWDDLTEKMKSILRKSGKVDKKGRVKK